MKGKTKHTIVRCHPIRSKGEIDIPTTHIHGRSLSWFGIYTSMKSGVIKLV
jgi:hypothetical protein